MTPTELKIDINMLNFFYICQVNLPVLIDYALKRGNRYVTLVPT